MTGLSHPDSKAGKLQRRVLQMLRDRQHQADGLADQRPLPVLRIGPGRGDPQAPRQSDCRRQGTAGRSGPLRSGLSPARRRADPVELDYRRNPIGHELVHRREHPRLSARHGRRCRASTLGRTSRRPSSCARAARWRAFCAPSRSSTPCRLPRPTASAAASCAPASRGI